MYAMLCDRGGEEKKKGKLEEKSYKRVRKYETAEIANNKNKTRRTAPLPPERSHIIQHPLRSGGHIRSHQPVKPVPAPAADRSSASLIGPPARWISIVCRSGGAAPSVGTGYHHFRYWPSTDQVPAEARTSMSTSDEEGNVAAEIVDDGLGR